MANVFLEQNEVFPIGAGADARVFGRQGGNEGVSLQSGAENVSLDANMERIDVAENSSDVSLQVSDNGLEVRRSDGSTIASVRSLNQDADVRFNDGNVTVRQSGATSFEVEGSDGSTQTVDTQGSANVSVPLGNETAGDATNGGGGDGTSNSVDVSANNTGPFDAGGGDVTYNVAAGTYTAEVQNFDSGDELRPFDGASVTVQADSDLSDGRKTIEFGDAETSTIATLELTGLTSQQDSNVFNRGSINDVFGDGTIPDPSSSNTQALVGIGGTDDPDIA